METYLFLYVDITKDLRLWFATEATSRLAAIINFLEYLDVDCSFIDNDYIDKPDQIIKDFNACSEKIQITNMNPLQSENTE